MGSDAPLLELAVVLGMAGVGALRYAWGLPRRSPATNAVGWALLALAMVAGGVAGGAWGVAVTALCAMLAACILLAVAGARSPARHAKASNRRVGMLPEQGEPRWIGRRMATFLLVIVAGFAVSVGLGLAMRGLGGALGWSEANANVVALYTVPMAWSVLAFVLLMQQTRRSQIVTLLACAVPAVPVLLGGVV